MSSVRDGMLLGIGASLGAGLATLWMNREKGGGFRSHYPEAGRKPEVFEGAYARMLLCLSCLPPLSIGGAVP